MDTSVMTAASMPDVPSAPAVPKIQISDLAVDDLPAVSQLHDRVFGPGRFARTAYRVREGAPAISPACRKLTIDGALSGAVQMTVVTVGMTGAKGMLLGPLVVDEPHKNVGHGQALMAQATAAADVLGMGFVILVGDLPYYARAGFERVPPGQITLPGPVDQARLLIRVPGSGAGIPDGALKAVTDAS